MHLKDLLVSLEILGFTMLLHVEFWEPFFEIFLTYRFFTLMEAKAQVKAIL